MGHPRVPAAQLRGSDSSPPDQGIDFTPLIEALDGSTFITTGENITAAEFLNRLPQLEGTLYGDIASTFNAESEGERASAIELAVEALHLTQKISKDSGEGESIYG